MSFWKWYKNWWINLLPKRDGFLRRDPLAESLLGVTIMATLWASGLYLGFTKDPLYFLLFIGLPLGLTLALHGYWREFGKGER